MVFAEKGKTQLKKQWMKRTQRLFRKDLVTYNLELPRIPNYMLQEIFWFNNSACVKADRKRKSGGKRILKKQKQSQLNIQKLVWCLRI